MRVLVFMTLLQIYACRTPQGKSRSVNLALETIVEFDNNENSADVQIIDKVRNFLDRVKFAIDKNKVYRRSLPSGTLKFTEFVRHALAILNSYKDGDLEDVCSVVDEEMRKYHYKGCKFYELLENKNVRRYMANNLDSIKNAPAKEVRKQLQKMLNKFENNNFNLMQKAVVDYVDSLYGDRSEDKFRNVLDKLSLYGSRTKRSNLNLVKIVRDAVRSVVFDHYSKLDFETRRDLKIKLETFWKDFTDPTREHHSMWSFGRLDKSNENFKQQDDEGSSSLDDRATTKRRKTRIGRDRHEQILDKEAERQKEDLTTKRRLTFITLYPEAITLLDNRRGKTRTTKSIKQFHQSDEIKYYGKRDHERQKGRINKKKDKLGTKIVSEHAAVINVEKAAVGRVFSAINKLLDDTLIQTPETTMRAVNKVPRRGEHTYTSSERVLGREQFQWMSKFDYQPIERTSDHKKHRKSKHKRSRHPKKKSRKSDNVRLESDEGLSIKSFEESDPVETSFRKSNLNDTLNINYRADETKIINNQALSTPVPEANFIKRINDLENELKVVKEQIKVTNPDSHEPPHYDQLDFWEGTTKGANESTPKLTTIRTSTTKTIITTAKPKTTKVTTTKLTTKVDNNTFSGVFRTEDTKEVEKKAPEKKEKEEKVIAKKEETLKNITGVMPMSHVNLNEPVFNHSAEMDYFNDVKEPEMNVTGIEDIERYLNESKPIVNDRNHQLVRSKMLEQLKGLFTAQPDKDANFSALFPSTPMIPMVDDHGVTSDPLNFLDVGDDI